MQGFIAYYQENHEESDEDDLTNEKRERAIDERADEEAHKYIDERRANGD